MNDNEIIFFVSVYFEIGTRRIFSPSINFFSIEISKTFIFSETFGEKEFTFCNFIIVTSKILSRGIESGENH